MPTQPTRVNPLDLQGNIAIGVALPFGRIDVTSLNNIVSSSYTTGPGVFTSTYSTKDQIKSNLINLILTDKGERVFNPEFGAGIRKMLFEGIVDSTFASIKELIINNAKIFVPDAQITDISINPDTDNNSISITISYKLRISGTADQITVEFV
jgi:hypothetical protein